MCADYARYIERQAQSDAERRAAGLDKTPRLRQPVGWGALGALPSFAPVVERVKQLMAANTAGDGLPTFSVHHQHANVVAPGGPGVDWHHVRTAPFLALTARQLTRLAHRTTCRRPRRTASC